MISILARVWWTVSKSFNFFVGLAWMYVSDFNNWRDEWD